MAGVLSAVRKRTHDVIVLAEPSFDLPLSFIARSIRAIRPGARIIASHRGPSSVAPSILFKHGVYAVLCDDYSASELRQAVGRAEAGKMYISEAVAEFLVYELRAEVALHLALSDQQAEVLYLLIRGYSVKEIAERLLTSCTSVSRHQAAIKRHLGVRTNSELIQYAVEHRLVQRPESCS